RNRSATDLTGADAPTAAGGHPPTRPLLAVRGRPPPHAAAPSPPYAALPAAVAAPAAGSRRDAPLRAVVPLGRHGWAQRHPVGAGPRHPPRARTRAGHPAGAGPRDRPRAHTHAG
ncbi:hypothetical protein ACIRP5_03630, partial [Streptomyces sp. NPDC101221]